MINAIIHGLLNALMQLFTLLMTPINALFTHLFPDVSNMLVIFNNFMTNFITNKLSYFFYIFPPIFKTLLVLFITFAITYYSVYYAYKAYIKVFNIIHKLKFW